MSQALVRDDGISEYEQRVSERYFSEWLTREMGDRFLRVWNAVLGALL
jgi:hypothetical protein